MTPAALFRPANPANFSFAEFFSFSFSPPAAQASVGPEEFRPTPLSTRPSVGQRASGLLRVPAKGGNPRTAIPADPGNHAALLSSCFLAGGACRHALRAAGSTLARSLAVPAVSHVCASLNQGQRKTCSPDTRFLSSPPCILGLSCGGPTANINSVVGGRSRYVPGNVTSL